MMLEAEFDADQNKKETAAAAYRGSASHDRAALRTIVSSHSLEIRKIMDWVPIVFMTFKVVVFAVCMFFAIKWHYDQGKKKKK